MMRNIQWLMVCSLLLLLYQVHLGDTKSLTEREENEAIAEKEVDILQRILKMLLKEENVIADKLQYEENVKRHSADDRKNVLMIIVDDLRPEIGAYATASDADNSLYKDIITPNMDSLSKDSMLFKSAMTQYPSCGPSRASFLTGRRPDTTQVHRNNHNFRVEGGNFTTIPQYFKENGYVTYCAGKVFHSNNPDENDYSWTQDCFEEVGTAFWYKIQFSDNSWGKVDDAKTVTNPLPDQQISSHITGLLDTMAADQRFFIAAGFRKPHLPFICPESYFDKYDVNDISLPADDLRYVPSGLTELNWASWLDLHGYADMSSFDNSYNKTLPDAETIELRHAYYACTTYVDQLIGELLLSLKDNGFENNTVVALFSDHGFHLGEHAQWTKASLLGLDARVPLLIKVPGITDDGGTWETEEFVELVDIFPTLVDAAGLAAIPQCPADSSNVDVCHEGLSAFRFINETGKSGKSCVYTQYKRGNKMGYRICNSTFCYIRFVTYPSGAPNWRYNPPSLDTEELYPQLDDPDETVNIINEVNFGPYVVADVVSDMRTLLETGYTTCLPADI